MTIDKQQSHWWTVVRAWRFDGSSRLLFFGKVLTRDQLEAIRIRYNVLPILTMEDASYKDTEVFKDCADYGWLAIRGDEGDRKAFRHAKKLPNGKVKIEWKLYSIPQTVYGDNRPVKLVWLASEKLKDKLAWLRSGQGPKWEIPAEIGSPENTVEYHRHMNGETKREKPDGRGGSTWYWHETHDNHAWDCEYYQVAAALQMGLMPGEVEAPEEEVQAA